GQTRHSWDRTAQRLADADCTALALDLRGHGDSDWAPDGTYGLEANMRDLLAVLGQLDERPAIVGASMGGAAAMMTLGNDPLGGVGLARRLVLVDVTPRMEPEGLGRVRDFMSSAPDGFASLEEAADAVAGYLPGRPRPVSTEGLAKNLRLHPDQRYRWHWDPRIMVGFALNDEDRHAVLATAASGVRVPTLLVRGARSDVVNEEGMRELSTLIPDVQFAEVGQAGHMVAGDSNDPFTDTILAFVGTGRTAR
ncbi:MAG: hypothetical protein JWO57_1652, partial [Pseudonocardiales bacterium]|nr:hypothetical protein [Pseudonocardiales bacterium]